MRSFRRRDSSMVADPGKAARNEAVSFAIKTRNVPVPGASELAMLAKLPFEVTNQAPPQQAVGYELRFPKQPVSNRPTPQAAGNPTRRD
jgi:hypothetical protein